ncbi:Cathepsin L [Folsomia candida]|uniref:Cathepsin L n=1 Tax=Folsomia candida TaxID=158441 RepID=A0A226DTL9_FOLCA|nr:Cathepsin L [Folsomia candida]
MARLNVLAILLVVAVFSEVLLADKPDWVAFKKQHRKEFKSRAAEAKAKAKFDKNAARVDEHNKKFEKGEVQYKIAINQFADQDPEEFHQHHHGLKPELDRNDSRRSASHERYTRELPPAAFDYRSTNQTIAAAMSAIESQVLIAGRSPVTLSVQQLLDCDIYDTGCEGGWPSTGFLWLKKHGGSKAESDYPYTSGCCDTAGPCGGANAPVVQQLSGYGADATGKQYWIIKNSWDVGWGDKGFGYVPVGQANNTDCGISQGFATYPIII